MPECDTGSSRLWAAAPLLGRVQRFTQCGLLLLECLDATATPVAESESEVDAQQTPTRMLAMYGV
jgi:hypothetical protein